MRKLSAFLLLLSVLALSSCGRGVSISYMTVRAANDAQAILSKDGVAAYKETLKYYSANGNVLYEYSVYMEKNSGGAKPYNVRECHPDGDIYAYEGEIYSVKDGKIYSILQAFGTYYDFTEKYTRGNIALDDCVFYQLYSESSGGVTTVAYYSEMLPETMAKYSAMGVKPGDTIKAVYELDGENVARKITYFIRENGDETKERALLCRQFEYYSEKQDEFASVPSLDKTVKVQIIYSDDHVQTFAIPEGTFAGIDTAGRNIKFFSDAEMTVPFDFTTAAAFDGMKIYAAAD